MENSLPHDLDRPLANAIASAGAALAEHIDRLPQGPVTVGLALVRQDDGANRSASCATSPCPARRDRGSATYSWCGPSGGGKDSLIAARAPALPADRFCFPTRVITRAGDAGARCTTASTRRHSPRCAPPAASA